MPPAEPAAARRAQGFWKGFIQMPTSPRGRLQQPGGPGYLQSLLRPEVGQQENPFLQQQARFQYPPGLHQEQEKEQEQERPRMHNGKKVSNINISMVEYSEIFLFPGPKPPDDLLERPDPGAGAEVPAD